MKSWSVLFVLLFLLVAATTAFAAPAAGSAQSCRGILEIVEPEVENTVYPFTVMRPPSRTQIVRCPTGDSRTEHSVSVRCLWRYCPD
jgi:hypothetical protein